MARKQKRKKAKTVERSVEGPAAGALENGGGSGDEVGHNCLPTASSAGDLVVSHAPRYAMLHAAVQLLERRRMCMCTRSCATATEAKSGCAFLQGAEDEEVEVEAGAVRELVARFSQAVAELQRMGFVSRGGRGARGALQRTAFPPDLT